MKCINSLFLYNCGAFCRIILTIRCAKSDFFLFASVFNKQLWDRVYFSICFYFLVIVDFLENSAHELIFQIFPPGFVQRQ